MSASDVKMVLTYAGSDLLAEMAVSKKPLVFTRLVYGDGEQSEGLDLKSVTSLINEKMVLPMKAGKVLGNGQARIDFYASNANVESPGFAIREVGVFAKLEGDSNEILYAYAYYGQYYNWMFARVDGQVVDHIQKLYISVHAATDVKFTIDTNLAFATDESFQSHLQDKNAHRGFLPVIGAEAIVSSGSSLQYVLGDFGNGEVKRVPSQQLQAVLLGNNATAILNADERLKAIERRQDEMIMYNAAQSMYPDSSSLMYGAFGQSDSDIDTFSCKVTATAAGDDSIYVASLTGIVPGAHYTLTDGIRSEEIQVDSCVKQGGKYLIMCKEAVKETYTLTDAMLYRTTANISSSGAEGSSDVKSVNWKPGTEWKGNMSGAEIEFKLDTTLDKIDDFEIEGDITFTADGQITLREG